MKVRDSDNFNNSLVDPVNDAKRKSIEPILPNFTVDGRPSLRRFDDCLKRCV